MEKTYKPIVAGILDIVAGAGGIIAWLFISLGIIWLAYTPEIGASFNIPTFESRFIPVLIILLAIPLIVLSILAIIGGVFALKRRTWGLALAGSIGALFCSTILGIVAIIFTVLSKQEFDQSKNQ